MTTPDAGHTSQPGDHDGRPAGAHDASGAFVAYDQFIDNQLHTARRQVRTVDIAVSLTTLGAGTLGFFLLAALADHWLFSGGLGTVGRWLALAVYLVGALAWCWRSLLPLCIHRINPVYAAYTIERSKPTLKNSLINFLLLRAKPTDLAPHVYEAIEQHAATELAQVPVESTIDRSQLIKIGYVFLGLVLVAAIYKVSSPKDPFQTVGRIVLPWADIAPPTRVTIVEVRPGNSTVMRGQRAKISAQVQGIAGRQTVRLVYGTDDGQIVDRAVPMQVPPEGYLFECELPEGKGGIQQNVNYRVLAGDATSSEYRLTVQAAPTMVVESVDYAYPGYTGMVSQTVDHQGDLKAIEGTQVTLHALANQPIKSATVDFDASGGADQRMTFDDRHATATFTLALKPDRQTPEHTSYQLRFANAEGNENPQPIRHQIEVARDVSPEIQFLAPKQDEIEMPLNGTLLCEVSAHDPDFALARVALVGQSVAGQPLERALLDEPDNNGRPWQGQFRKKLALVPQKLGLKVGDVLEYWAWAEDNKTPLANRTETIHRRARIVSPTKADSSPDSLARDDQQSADQPSGGRSPDDKQGQNDPDAPDDENPSNEAAEPPPPGADPARPRNPNRDGAGPPNPDPQAAQQPDKGDSMRNSPAENQNRNEKEQADKQEQAGDERPEQESSAQQQSGEGSTGKGQSGNSKAGKNQSGSDASGQAGSESGDSGDSSGNDSQAGEGQGNKAGAQSKQSSKGSRGAKRQPVAKDGTQDGEAFDEIMEQQNEQKHGDSEKGTRQTTTRRSGTPPASGSPAEQNQEDGSGNEQPGDQEAAEKKGSDQSADGKQSGAQKSADKMDSGAGTKNGDQQQADKSGSGKKSDERGGTDPGKKPPGGQQNQVQHPNEEKTDPAGHADEQTPASESPSENSAVDTDGESAATKKQANDGKNAPGGKPGGERTPGGKPMAQAGDGEEKKSSEGGGQSDSNPQDRAKSGQPGSGKLTPEKQNADKEAAENRKGQKQPPNGQSNENSTSDQSPAGAKPDKTAMPQKAGDGTKKTAGDEAQSKDGDRPGEPSGRQGAQPRDKAGQKPTQKPDRNHPAKGKSGDGQADQGDSGAGQKSADDQPGSPKPEGANRPSKKSPGDGNKPDRDGEKSGNPPSPSVSDHQSDSEGGEDGDRSGGGKKGDGQKSQQAGSGGQGSHAAADEGGKPEADRGGEESSDQPGTDREAEKPTGQPGQKPGPGSKAGSQPGTRSEPAGDKGNRSDKPADGQRQSDDKPATDASGGNSPSGNRGKAGPGQGGGNAADSQQAEPPAIAPEQADEANLEFTRKATELTIQRLRDQLAKGTVDQELLDRLQWSQQDMENWVRRWEEMFRRSEQQGKEGQAARVELDATLRSLGLRPHGTVVSGHRRDDTARGMKEGRRTQPPAEYRDQVRQYLQGVSRTPSGATTGRDTTVPRQSAPAAKGNDK